MSVPTTVQQVAGWDVAELRGGVGRLDQVADRLLPWRTRLDVLGRQLGRAECWSGPAGTAAATAVVELSTVASGVSGALGESLTDLQALSAAATEAQEWAAGAVATAAVGRMSLDGSGSPIGLPAPPSAAMAADQVAEVLADRQAGRLAAARAEEALLAAARALACARAARQPLAGVGTGGRSGVGFADLAARLPAARPLPGPPDPGPQRVAAWWAGLSAAEQLAETAARPAVVGALDGLPAWARDQANRYRLSAALATLPAGEQRRTAEVLAGRLTALDRAGRTAQLVQFDPAADLVAVSLGDLDTAAAVGVLVPGINTTPADDLPGLLGSAAAIGSATEAAAPGLTVATVAWLGYRTPGLGTMALPAAARRGGPALDRALDGLAVARAVPGGTGGAGGTAGVIAPPRTTVVAHSYGTVVTGQAARAPGRLAADAVVLLGSPGLAGGEAADLEAGEVHGAWSVADPVSWLQWFGDTPSDPSFGDSPLPTELTEGHTDYLDPDRPTLAAVGEVVAGVRVPG
ncbi:alpha/beta hydrolase [Modestobacter altitudinis]|uniref:alpha/beta hydrolase n=1 Tax=Modestobacter altitudinis TaxID=2213158 RepID=UPI00110D1F57|nr:alpha/beta hydrolase [Modestobacter altitudinis]